jgi:hypothetical protein
VHARYAALRADIAHHASVKADHLTVELDAADEMLHRFEERAQLAQRAAELLSDCDIVACAPALTSRLAIDAVDFNALPAGSVASPALSIEDTGAALRAIGVAGRVVA